MNPDAGLSRWARIKQAMTRPYRVTLSMVLLVMLVPGYLFIAEYTVTRAVHYPELAIDRAVPVVPVWSLIYGSLYVFVFLPVLVVHQEEQIHRTVRAYLMVWTVAYLGFLLYPTAAPRPARLDGDGFFVWWLKNVIYSTDPPYNCFPSLHVAHAVVSALTCYHVHRGVGVAALIWAGLIGVSTLYTKQHYFVDVVAGILLACVAYVLFLRSYPREAVPEFDRRVAPLLASGFLVLHALLTAGLWVAYRLTDGAGG